MYAKFKSLILLFSDAKWSEQEGNKVINIRGILLYKMFRNKLLEHNNDNLRDSFYQWTGNNKLLFHNNGPIL